VFTVSVIVVVGWAYALLIFYLAYVAIWVAKSNGKLALVPAPGRWVLMSILAVAVLLDVLFNWVVGSVGFMELPRECTFTARCARLRTATGYRGRLARWVCDGWLNPFQEHHC
jgi:hypothetical protein